MKVGQTNEPLIPDPGSRIGARPANGAGSGADAGAIVPADKVELSKTSRDLSSTGTQSFSPDRVAEVKSAIQDGSFHVNAQVVAERMISEAAELVETIASGKK